MYKLSKFNISFKNDDVNFLYNSHSSNFVKLNGDYSESLEFFRQNELEKVPENHLNDFLKGGFIVNSDLDENEIYKYLRNKKKLSNDSLVLTIATTLKCNFRCSYCYEEHLDKQIDEAEEEAIKNFIDKNIVNKKVLSVAWYGGEPLLNVGLIERLSTYFIKLTDEMDISYNSNIVSNGYLLNKKMAERLVKNKINAAQITLDGGPDTHNKSRFLANNKGTFDVILKNVKEIYDIMRVNIRVNVSKDNMNDVYKLLDIIKKEKLMNYIGIYFAPVMAYNNTACNSISDACLNSMEFANIENELIDYALKLGFKMNLYPISRLGGLCGAVNDTSFVIDPYGDLFKCWHEVGHKDYRVGNIYDGLTSEQRFYKWVNWELPNKCEECDIMPVCNGRCPSLSLDGIDFDCFPLKYNIKDKLFKFYINNNVNKEKVEEESIL